MNSKQYFVVSFMHKLSFEILKTWLVKNCDLSTVLEVNYCCCKKKQKNKAL